MSKQLSQHIGDSIMEPNELNNLLSYIKSFISPFIGILLGSFLSFIITSRQVKKNNRFTVLKEVKLELMKDIDELHKNVNLLISMAQKSFVYIDQRNYLEVRSISEEVLHIFNETLNKKNSLISNYELLNLIYNDYKGKSNLSEFIKLINDFSHVYDSKIYSFMSSPTFCSEHFVNDAEYSAEMTSYVSNFQDEDFRRITLKIGESHLGANIEFINSKLAKLIR